MLNAGTLRERTAAANEGELKMPQSQLICYLGYRKSRFFGTLSFLAPSPRVLMRRVLRRRRTGEGFAKTSGWSLFRAQAGRSSGLDGTQARPALLKTPIFGCCCVAAYYARYASVIPVIGA
jgi:hypothetical protein